MYDKSDAMAVAIEKMHIMASAPQKSYRRLVDDLNHLAGTIKTETTRIRGYKIRGGASVV